MTLIVGMKCQKGVIVCADSQQTDNDGNITRVTKVETRNYGSFQVILAGSGPCGDTIDDLAEDILEDIKTWRVDISTTELKDRIRKQLLRVDYKDENDILEFVLALRRKDTGVATLRKLSGHDITPEKSYIAIGSGYASSNAILNSHYTSEMELMRAIMLGVQALSVTKQLKSSVGLDTRIAGLLNGVYHAYLPKEIRAKLPQAHFPTMWIEDQERTQELELLTRNFDGKVSGLLLDCVDMAMGENAFDKALSDFVAWANVTRNSYIDEALCRNFEPMLSVENGIVRNPKPVAPYMDFPQVTTMSAERYPRFAKLMEEWNKMRLDEKKD